VRVNILAKAEDDLFNGFAFYEGQQEGLGAYFRERLFDDIDSLRVLGGSHRVVYRDYHRALSKRFPWAIFYRVSGETVYIEAVVDCRRKPRWIKEHLRDS
jgi:hypothetical protein